MEITIDSHVKAASEKMKTYHVHYTLNSKGRTCSFLFCKWGNQFHSLTNVLARYVHAHFPEKGTGEKRIRNMWRRLQDFLPLFVTVKWIPVRNAQLHTYIFKKRKKETATDSSSAWLFSALFLVNFSHGKHSSHRKSFFLLVSGKRAAPHFASHTHTCKQHVFSRKNWAVTPPMVPLFFLLLCPSSSFETCT